MSLTIKDFAGADELELDLMKWRTEACVAVLVAKDEKLIDRIEASSRIKPKAIANAYRLFGDVIRSADDFWMVYTAWKCGEVKDDNKARAVFDEAMASGWGTKRLKEAVTKANTRPQREKKATLAERCAALVAKWKKMGNLDNVISRTDIARCGEIGACADELAAIPEIAAALKREKK